MFKKDKTTLGIVLGLLAPIAAMFMYYAIMLGNKISLSEFFYYLRTNKSLLTGVSSVSLIANAVLFTIFINRHLDKTAKGLFISTLVYGIAVLLFKLVG
jgi:tryptophan-rich sensory protein